MRHTWWKEESCNMMEKETYVDSEQTDIGQLLFDIVEDQSEVHRSAEIAISGL